MQPSAVQSFQRHPLTYLLGSQGHVRVLRALVRQGQPLGVAQIAADARMTARGVRLVLESLLAQGVLKVFGQPRAQVYGLDSSHPMVPALLALFEHERNRWESLVAGLKRGLAAMQDVRAAWLYGSVARAEDAPRSDMDIAVLAARNGSKRTQTIRDAITALGDTLGVNVSLVVLQVDELARLPRNDAWFANVIQDAWILKGAAPATERTRCAKEVEHA